MPLKTTFKIPSFHEIALLFCPDAVDSTCNLPSVKLCTSVLVPSLFGRHIAHVKYKIIPPLI